ncbi:MAG: SAM-dependent methyltransferase [Balneolaceae bacterium]|nr:MAG: SAM-dependent methyltransferase [Balneolaceae bacterium]
MPDRIHKNKTHTQDGPRSDEQAPGPGRLFLIPTPLGPHPENQVLPEHVIRTVHRLDTFFVERIRQANSFLRWINHPVPDFKCRFYELNKHTPGEDLLEMVSLLKNGSDGGIITEAGCPGVADPGSELVRLAHESGIDVVPLTGPSSILLALMASGMNGQAFAFHGYLPRPGRERTERIRFLENESAKRNLTQVFMETPYRNNDLLKELVRELADTTRLCVASDLTLPEEQIISCRVTDWRKRKVDLDKRPSIFLLLAEEAPTGSRNNKKPAHRRKRAGK